MLEVIDYIQYLSESLQIPQIQLAVSGHHSRNRGIIGHERTRVMHDGFFWYKKKVTIVTCTKLEYEFVQTY